MRKIAILVSCEHAGNHIPKEFAAYFQNAHEQLATHRGLDIGSKILGVRMSEHLDAPLFMTEISRLLVECNRSLDHPQLYSEFTRHLTPSQKELLIEEYYLPHRQRVTERIAHEIAHARVLHLSIHTFTPVLHNEVRLTDIGLLFDEDRDLERSLCAKWREALQNLLPSYQIDFNKPYLGSDDGFTTHLRQIFPAGDYLGIEIEVNQKWADPVTMLPIADALSQSLKSVILNN